ncbi:S-adenosylmethionine synthase [Striga asiatica]|uniref:S-adenosylmethionine synthase n=1 Tax=Striga asiatica TaxID=4170 RepID=A0A5A7QPG9_STRAF|nr:S-adenosylmethionine synthase [Striga asiatica]
MNLLNQAQIKNSSTGLQQERKRWGIRAREESDRCVPGENIGVFGTVENPNPELRICTRVNQAHVEQAAYYERVAVEARNENVGNEVLEKVRFFLALFFEEPEFGVPLKQLVVAGPIGGTGLARRKVDCFAEV